MRRLRIFLAASKRDMLVLKRYPDWIVSLFVWPVLMPSLSVYAAKALAGPDQSGLIAFAERSGTTDYVGFVTSGMILWMWLNIVLWQVGGQLRAEQRRGTLESNWLTPAPRLAIVFGCGLTRMLYTMAPMLIALPLFRIMWRVDMAITPLLGLVFLTSTIAVYGIGLLFSSLVLFFKELNAMVFFVRGVFMIFCGMTYPISVLPRWMQAVSRALPLTYSIDLVRRVGLSGARFADISRDFAILAGFAAVLFALGCGAFLAVDRVVKRTGTLGQY